MNAMPASAPNALQALSHHEMFVGNVPVDLPLLRQAAEQSAAAGWADAFVLDVDAGAGILSDEDIESLADSCIASAYLVRDVWVVTASFGYKAGPTAAHPQSPVAPDEKLATIFPDPEGLTRFRAFAHTSQGAAVVIQLDTAAVADRLASLDGGHGDLATRVAADAQAMQRSTVRQLLATTGNGLLAYRSLHAVEHALLMAAMRQLGTDTLGSRLFPAEGAVVLFEKSRIGRGGVIQLVNRGPGLVHLVRAARDLMAGCAQGCAEGCPACVYLRDQHCAHPLEDLGTEWLPANALVSRAGAASILSPDMPH